MSIFDCDAMFGFFHFFPSPPSLKQLSLKPYRINFSLDRLALGVDNIHLDVHISLQAFEPDLTVLQFREYEVRIEEDPLGIKSHPGALGYIAVIKMTQRIGVVLSLGNDVNSSAVTIPTFDHLLEFMAYPDPIEGHLGLPTGVEGSEIQGDDRVEVIVPLGRYV